MLINQTTTSSISRIDN